MKIQMPPCSVSPLPHLLSGIKHYTNSRWPVFVENQVDVPFETLPRSLLASQQHWWTEYGIILLVSQEGYPVVCGSLLLKPAMAISGSNILHFGILKVIASFPLRINSIYTFRLIRYQKDSCLKASPQLRSLSSHVRACDSCNEGRSLLLCPSANQKELLSLGV